MAIVGVIGDVRQSSLTRVEQRVDDPSLSPIDLAALAETFDREIRSAVVVRQP